MQRPFVKGINTPPQGLRQNTGQKCWGYCSKQCGRHDQHGWSRKVSRSVGPHCETSMNARQGCPNQPERCGPLFWPFTVVKSKGPWIYVSICVRFNHRRNGTSLMRLAWAAEVSEGQIRWVDEEDVGDRTL